MPFTDEDGHDNKSFSKGKIIKYNTASQLLKVYANRNWSRRVAD